MPVGLNGSVAIKMKWKTYNNIIYLARKENITSVVIPAIFNGI